MRMIQLYHAPELRNYYCANYCPLGSGEAPTLTDNLDRIAVQLLIALRRMEQMRDELDNILVDGFIGEGEAERFGQIIGTLKELAVQTEALEVWAQHKGILQLPEA
jgi:hypothetical protein